MFGWRDVQGRHAGVNRRSGGRNTGLLADDVVNREDGEGRDPDPDLLLSVGVPDHCRDGDPGRPVQEQVEKRLWCPGNTASSVLGSPSLLDPLFHRRVVRWITRT